MSLIGRVHPDCANVNNPYHECTENCLRKIAEGKGRKNKKKTGSLLDVPILGRRKEGSRPKPPQELDIVSDRSVIYPFDAQSSPSKDKVKLENGSPLDDPIFGRRKQVSQQKPREEQNNVIGQENGSVLNDPIFGRIKQVSQPKPHGDLDNISSQGTAHPSDSPQSPSKEIASNGTTLDDLIFGARKKGSQPKPPEEFDNVPATGVFYNSDSQLSPSKEKVKSENGEYKSHSGQLSEVKDPSSNKDQVQSSLLVPTSGIIKMTPSLSFPTQNGGECANGSASENRSFSFSGSPRVFEESDDDDVQSVNSDCSVSVGRYRVKGSFSSILHSIIDKYGDIAGACKLESNVIRSYYLECVCYIIQELNRTAAKQLTKSKVKEMSAMLKDVESSGMDVGWLRLRLNECAETIDIVSQYRALEVTKVNCDRDIETTRKELESQMEVLALKEKEVADAKKQVAETRAHLRELELQSSLLSENVSDMKIKVENLQSKSLLDKGL